MTSVECWPRSPSSRCRRWPPARWLSCAPADGARGGGRRRARGHGAEPRARRASRCCGRATRCSAPGSRSTRPAASCWPSTASSGSSAVLVSPAFLAGRPLAARRSYAMALFAFWALLLAVPLAGNLAVGLAAGRGDDRRVGPARRLQRRRHALGGGWKYLVLTTLGLGVALFGTRRPRGQRAPGRGRGRAGLGRAPRGRAGPRPRRRAGRVPAAARRARGEGRLGAGAQLAAGRALRGAAARLGPALGAPSCRRSCS